MSEQVEVVTDVNMLKDPDEDVNAADNVKESDVCDVKSDKKTDEQTGMLSL